MEDYQIVLEDDLLEAYYQFKSGNMANIFRATRLLNFYKTHLTNVAQLKRINRGDDALKQQLAQAGYVSQPIEELANLTKLKLILSASNSSYPYVNVMGKDELDMNFTGTFKNTSRKKAMDHIKNLCLQANSILIYDKYIGDKSEKFLMQLFSLFPVKKFSLIYHGEQLKQETITKWKAINKLVTIKQDTRGDYRGFHDRYLVIDDKLEIILSSGFDNLLSNNNDFTYVLRVLS
jgi:hypothetical protein